MVASSQFFEAADGSGAPTSSAGFAVEGGKSTRVWQLNSPGAIDLTSAITLILGSANYIASPSGRITRTLPLADPEYPWLYASNIPSIKGFGSYIKAGADSTLEAAPFPYSYLWSNYYFTVESTPRPYPVSPDSSIRKINGSWYPETGGGTVAQTFSYVEEWNRWCDWDFIPQNDYITQQRGRMKLVSVDSANGKAYQAMPRMYMPNQVFKVFWFQVPLRFILSASSYVRRWRGRVNQNTWNGPGGLAFNPGELLYLSYSQKKYTPPVQETTNLGGGTTVISTDKLCNIELTFLHTQRTATALAAAPSNKNYVQGGHNLLPWSNRNFYYAQTTDASASPSWLSFPVELLFTDPDSPGGI